MKKIIVILLALFASGCLYAQEYEPFPPPFSSSSSEEVAPVATDDETVEEEKDGMLYGIGFGFSTGAGINTTEQDGYKNKVLFSGLGDIGVSNFLQFTHGIGFMLNFKYANNSFGVYPHNDENAVTELNVPYFNVSPRFYVSGFVIGVNFGTPMIGTIDPDIGSEIDIPTDYVESSTELVIGGMINIINNRDMMLTLDIMGGYHISEINKVPFVGDFDNKGNFWKMNPASLNIGLSFYYNFVK